MTNGLPTTARLSEDEWQHLGVSAEGDDRTVATQIRHLIKQDRKQREVVTVKAQQVERMIHP
jgi:hypothetical protein